jgi:hypothetical protein
MHVPQLPLREQPLQPPWRSRSPSAIAPRPIVHLGGLTFEVFLEQPQQIDEHRRLITYLDAVALSNDESMTMISDADLDLFDTTKKKI